MPNDFYYARGARSLIVGADPWSVARRVGEPRPDLRALADMMHFPLLPSSPHMSLLEGVSRLSREPTRNPAQAQLIVSIEKGADEIDRAIRSAIDTAWVGRRRACVLVTGGLDSAVIAALVAEQTGTVPILLAARGGLASRLEIARQDALARHLQADLVVLEDLPTFTAEPLLSRNAYSDFPSGGVFTHLWDFMARRAAALGADVVFTGEGGNEVFSPGLSLAYDQARSGNLATAVTTIGRTRDSDWSGAVARLFHPPSRALLPRMQSGRTRHPAVAGWRGRHAVAETSSSRRRDAQVRRLRAVGLTYSQIDVLLSLERSELFHAHTTAVAIPFVAPLRDPLTREAVARVAPAWRNPVRVGFQDKYLLRVVGRKSLPAEITEIRKIGISNQIAVVLRGADLESEVGKLAAGAEWAGLDLGPSFVRPELLPANVGLDWTRLLAIAAWATQGVTR